MVSAKKAAPRFFLFHGNDTLLSRKSLKQWEDLFAQKHADTTRYRIFTDDLNSADFAARLNQVAHDQPLFEDASLCVIYRPTALEKNRTGVYTEAILKNMQSLLKREASSVTVLVWEARRLPEEHHLKKWFAEHEERGLAKVYEFTVPAHRQLMEEAEAYIAEAGCVLTPEGRKALDGMALGFDKEQKSKERLRAGDVLVVDHRRWWLFSLLDTALLATNNNQITHELLKQCNSVGDPAASPFEIVTALERKEWERARQLLRTWEQAGVDEGNYFALQAILRQRYRMHLPHVAAAYALSLLGEMELLVKNGQLTPAWLMDIFIHRLQAGKESSLVPARKVWLETM